MNVKKLIIPLLITLLTFSAFSQQKQTEARTLLPNRLGFGKNEVVDTTHLRVWYALNADSIADINTYIDYQRLDIGKQLSRYYSWFVFNNDSLLNDWRKKNPKAGSAPIWLGPGGKKKSTWIQYEYADLYFQGGKLTEYACMPTYLERYNAYYTEDIPQQNWIIQYETQELLGYTCQKATCHFRGRNYIAWFAPDIPVRQGPWKLGGLPGLILKAHDTDKLYTFEATMIETCRQPIVRYEYPNYTNESRRTVQKRQREFTENWHKAVGYQKVKPLPDGSLEYGEKVSIHTPYEPLELE